MYADGTSKGVRSPRGSVRGCEREEDRRQGRIGRHFARPGFIAAPYIGTLCLGCRVARISTIIAGPIIKLEGPRSIARNCRFPYPGLQRFIASTLEAGNGGSPLHPSRWRINDPPIRYDATARSSVSFNFVREDIGNAVKVYTNRKNIRENFTRDEFSISR